MRALALVALVTFAGCASTKVAVPVWEMPPERADFLSKLAPDQVQVEVALIEIPARGLQGASAHPLTAYDLARLARYPGATLVSAPMLATTFGSPTRLWVGEKVKYAVRDGTKPVGTEVSVVVKRDGTAHVDISVTALPEPEGFAEEAYEAAIASLEIRWTEGPSVIEMPGIRRDGSGGLEPRVFVAIVEVRKRP